MSRHFRRGGASPEEYGDFFAWAELEPKSDFTWATYKWMKEGPSDWKYITKYTLEDEKKDGIWYEGGKVRMPSDEECLELMNNCTFAWKTASDGYACNGVLLSSKDNSNSIFMPASTGLRPCPTHRRGVTTPMYYISEYIPLPLAACFAP